MRKRSSGQVEQATSVVNTTVKPCASGFGKGYWEEDVVRAAAGASTAASVPTVASCAPLVRCHPLPLYPPPRRARRYRSAIRCHSRLL
ncbi:unnamed protein product [Gadus morhua 'NCC']